MLVLCVNPRSKGAQALPSMGSGHNFCRQFAFLPGGQGQEMLRKSNYRALAKGCSLGAAVGPTLVMSDIVVI